MGRINLRSLGLGLQAIIRVRTIHAHIKSDLERVVDTLAAHGSVTTSLVLSTAVRKRVRVLASRN